MAGGPEEMLVISDHVEAFAPDASALKPLTAGP
jgi:hypothetical protein